MNWGDAGFGGDLACTYAFLVVATWSGVLLASLHWLRCWRLPAARVSGRDAGEVAVVVCAREEGPLLERCLSACRRAAPRAEIVLVLDGGGEAPAIEGVRVIRGTEPPRGWSGRAWACTRGASETGGDWLAFVDADAWLEEDGLAALLAHARSHRLDLLHTWGGLQELAGPEALAVSVRSWIVRAALPMRAIHRPADPAAHAAPGVVLVRRAAYEAVDGHGADRGALLPDLALARALAREGYRVGAALAPHGWRVAPRRRRWFDARAAVVLWNQLGRRPARVFGLCLFGVVGVLLPWLALPIAGRLHALLGGAGWWTVGLSGVAAAIQLALGVVLVRADGVPARWGLVFPGALLLACGELVQGMLVERVDWKGRRFRDGWVEER